MRQEGALGYVKQTTGESVENDRVVVEMNVVHRRGRRGPKLGSGGSGRGDKLGTNNAGQAP